MGTLIRTQCVLERVGEGAFGGSIFSPPRDGDEPVLRRYELTLDPMVWDDMGRPETITISIEPGDRLNEDAA